MKYEAKTRQRIYHLFSKDGYTRKFIARALEIPYSTVCWVIRELQDFKNLNPLF